MKFIMALSMKVKIIIIACTVAAAAAVGAVIIINSEDAYRVIKVFELNGSAVVTRESTGDIDAYTGMNLESGDTLSVEENSTLRISLDSDKYILLDGGTVLKLIAQGTAADSRTVIELQTGTILNEIKNSLSANSSYEVNTPKATMAVRGTTFTVTTRENPDGSYITDLHTSEGVVSVQLFDENGAPKGKEVYVKKDGSVTVITDVNDKTGNPAPTDGNSHFVLPDGNGSYTKCSEEKAVRYNNVTATGEAQTESAVTSVPSDTSITETSEAHSETAITSAETVKTERTDHSPVSPAAITFSEKREAYSVTDIPEQTTSTEPVTTAAPVTSYEPVTTTLPVSAAETETTSVRTVTTVPSVITEPASTTVPTAMTVPTGTPPAVTTVPTTVTEPVVTTVPTSATEPDETTVPTTETESTESETTVSETESEPADTESSATTEETTSPTPVYKVSFIDENGNVLSEAEFDENEKLGTIPPITDKKGYTAKWVSGGIEVTENTEVSADMEITAEYTAKPVTFYMHAPIGNSPRNTYGVIDSFTVLYDRDVMENDKGYIISALSEMVDARYEEFYQNYGREYTLMYVCLRHPEYGDYHFTGNIAPMDWPVLIYENPDGTLYTDVYFVYGGPEWNETSG